MLATAKSTESTSNTTVVQESVTVSVEASSQKNAKATTAAVAAADAADALRELPIFSNPLLANATLANSVPIQPKSARVKVGKQNVAVLKINAPRVDGDIVVIRRLDNDLVNATSMFKAAYPAISEKMEVKETSYIVRTYAGVVEKSGAFAGTWISLENARELAKQYEIDQFMRPLLEAANPKNKALQSELSRDVETKTKVVETVTTTTVVETEVAELQVASESATSSTTETVVNETTEKMQELTVDDVVVMKRRIEELEDEVERGQKKFRGVVAVAVGLAAASVIPTILPFLS